MQKPSAPAAIWTTRSPRIRVFLQAVCLERDEHQRRRCRSCHILNISQSGCLVLEDAPILVDRLILQLLFKVPWSGEQIQTVTRVMRSEVTNRGIQIGLHFAHICPENRKRLDRLIETISRPDHVVHLLDALTIPSGHHPHP